MRYLAWLRVQLVLLLLSCKALDQLYLALLRVQLVLLLLLQGPRPALLSFATGAARAAPPFLLGALHASLGLCHGPCSSRACLEPFQVL